MLVAMFSLSEITSLFDLSKYLDWSLVSVSLSESLSQKVKSPNVSLVPKSTPAQPNNIEIHEMQGMKGAKISSGMVALPTSPFSHHVKAILATDRCKH